jgi:branched-chain amino acid transport system permease protein
VGYVLARVVPLPLAAIFAAAIVGVAAMGLDFVLFRRLEQAGARSKMIASAGVAIAVRALVQLFWGVNPRMFPPISAEFTVFGLRVTIVQAVILATTAVSVVVFHLLLTRTQFGRSVRATSDNRFLVEVRGISSRSVISKAWFVTGALAGLAGVLLGLETYVRPALGQSMLLPLFAAALVGGLGSPYGAIVGALMLSLGQTAVVSINFGGLLNAGKAVYLGSQYKAVFAFAILVVVLLARPTGLFAEKRARA